MKIKKRATMIEMVVVWSFLVMLMIFSLNLVTNFNLTNPPLMLSTWQNFTRLTINCREDDICQKMVYCPLTFKEDYIVEVNNTNDIVEWEFQNLNKYIDNTQNCRTVNLAWYSLRHMSQSLQENTWWHDMFIINWIFYDSKMNKINGVLDKDSWTQIIDWMLYFN